MDPQRLRRRWPASSRAPDAPRASSTRSAATLADLDHVWTIDDGGVDDLTAAGTHGVADGELEDRRTAVSPATWPRSSTPPAPPAARRAASSPTATSSSRRPTSSARKDGDATLANVFQDEEASTLLFLPLAHVFARMIEVGVVMARGRARPHRRHQEPARRPRDVQADVHPVGAPGLREGLQLLRAEGRGRRQGQDLPRRRRHRDRLQRGAGRRRPRPGAARPSTRSSTSSSTASCAPRSAARCRWAVSGGAPLGPRLGHFFRGIGLTILEGYGLTETTAAAHRQHARHDQDRHGRPAPARRRDPDRRRRRDRWSRAARSSRGYCNNEAATAEALRDGWFHTGDIGELDDDGFLRITGRKKELIVTAGGKNVAPAVLEDRLRAHPLVSQCMVVGDAQPYIACLVTLDPEALPAWLEQHGKPAMSIAEAAEDPDVIAEIQAGGRRRQQGGVEGRGDQEVQDPHGRLDRGERPPHPVAEAQAQRRHEGVRRRGRRPLLLTRCAAIEVDHPISPAVPA